MNYYKLILDSNIVAIATDDNMRKFNPRNGMVLFSNVEYAQFLEVDGVFYRDDWLRPLPANDTHQFVDVRLMLIEQSEYNILSEAFESNEIIQDEQQHEEISVEETPQTDPIEEATIEFIRNSKIAEMSNACHQKIVDGVDVVLSDGEKHHFSLTIEDQIKIQSLALKAQTGEQVLPWHEDNHLCKFYSAADILAIYQALETIQVYETTYFNSLKMWILSLDSMEDIHDIQYGDSIPLEFQSEVLKYLMAQIGGGA